MLFIVGMRINRLAAVHRWLPVMIAMPRMLVELARNRDLGMIGTPRTLVSGRLIMVQQYWSSYEALERYAHDAGQTHLPAWRAFNQAARRSSAVGIFHETYAVTSGNHENIYVNITEPIFMGAAVGTSAIPSGKTGSRQRMSG